MMRLQLFARRNIHLRKPIRRKIGSPASGIFGNVTRDIRQLECYAKITRPMERLVILRIDAHYDRHHATDGAGNMIAIAVEVVFVARVKACRIQRKTVDEVVGVDMRNTAFARHHAQRVEGGIADPLAG